MADTPKKPDLGLLEEDDEFEEFPAEGILILLTTDNKNVGHMRVGFGSDAM